MINLIALIVFYSICWVLPDNVDLMRIRCALVPKGTSWARTEQMLTLSRHVWRSSGTTGEYRCDSYISPAGRYTTTITSKASNDASHWKIETIEITENHEKK